MSDIMEAREASHHLKEAIEHAGNAIWELVQNPGEGFSVWGSKIPGLDGILVDHGQQFIHVRFRYADGSRAVVSLRIPRFPGTPQEARDH